MNFQSESFLDALPDAQRVAVQNLLDATGAEVDAVLRNGAVLMSDDRSTPYFVHGDGTVFNGDGHTVSVLRRICALYTGDDHDPTTAEFDRYQFPYDFECGGCGATTTITHEDATEAARNGLFDGDPSVGEVVDHVKRSRGWWVTSPEGLACPDCLREADSVGG